MLAIGALQGRCQAQDEFQIADHKQKLHLLGEISSTDCGRKEGRRGGGRLKEAQN